MEFDGVLTSERHFHLVLTLRVYLGGGAGIENVRMEPEKAPNGQS